MSCRARMAPDLSANQPYRGRRGSSLYGYVHGHDYAQYQRAKAEHLVA
jgi:hypothetical protein